MRTISLFLFFMLCICLLNSQKCFQIETGTTNTLKSLAKQTEQKIWAVGRQGTILKSVDSAKTWNQVNLNIKIDLNTVYFYNELIGWMGGANGQLFKSTDGGESWNQVNSIPNNYDIYSVYFQDELNGFIGEPYGIILSTNNGGKSWNTFDYNCKGGDCTFVIDFYFINSQTGFALTDGSILKTENKGKSWFEIYYAYGKLLNDFEFRNEMEVFVSSSCGEFLYSKDGAKTFEIISRPGGMREFILLNDYNIIGTGYNTHYKFSKNQGNSFTTIYCNNNNSSYEQMTMIQLNPKEVLECGMNGWMYKIDISKIITKTAENLENDQMYIYPNPTFDKIEIKNTLIPFEIFIYNSNSELVYSDLTQSIEQIDLQNYLSGVYTCFIITNGTRSIERFIKL